MRIGILRKFVLHELLEFFEFNAIFLWEKWYINDFFILIKDFYLHMTLTKVKSNQLQSNNQIYCKRFKKDEVRIYDNSPE